MDSRIATQRCTTAPHTARQSPQNRAFIFYISALGRTVIVNILGRKSPEHQKRSVHMDPSNNVAQYNDPYRRPQEPWNNSSVPSSHPYASASPQASYTSANPSSITVVDSDIPNDGNKVPRDITRTPSPTPSEAKQLRTNGMLSGEDVRNWRFWFRREWFCALPSFMKGSFLTLTRVLCRAERYYHPDYSHAGVPRPDY